MCTRARMNTHIHRRVLALPTHTNTDLVSSDKLELLLMYEKASKQTAIREKVYQRYSDTAFVCQKNDERIGQVADYLEHERNRRTSRNNQP